MDKPRGPEHLHAPWRMEYVQQIGSQPPGCVFCQKGAAQQDAENYVLYRGAHVFVMLNLFPYNCGHLMIVPYQHTAELAELSPEAQAEMMALAAVALEAVRRAMSPDGFNLGMNLGRPAGAGIEDHLHLHVVPRWSGDTNFMPVIGNTRVLPESLDRTWEKLRAAFREVQSEGCP